MFNFTGGVELLTCIYHSHTYYIETVFSKFIGFVPF